MTRVKTFSHDPVHNFAIERELLEHNCDFLLLYINSPCVVLGRNQSAEAEADLEYCALEGLPVIHRISGGGAVYQDLGNINWAFVTTITDTTLPLNELPLSPLIAALRDMGVDAIAGGRGELLVSGKKISGTATYAKRGRRLFHGTLLWDADLDRMHRALSGNPEKRGRKVASVPCPTANLKNILDHTATATQFMETIATGIARHCR